MANGLLRTFEGRPRRYVPALAPMLDRVAWLAYPLVRFTCGALLIPHGWAKLFGGGLAGTAAGMAKSGLEPAYALAVYIACLEFFGGLMIATGFLTRLWALLVMGFMAVAAFHVHMPIAYFWNKAGMEMPLFWLLIATAVFLGGSGPLSVDRAIGREL
jgi:putative oxidoreductase